MKYLILAFLSLGNFALASSGFMEFGLDESKDRLKKKTHLELKIGFQQLNYHNSHIYDGTNKKFTLKEKESLLGMNALLGYQIGLTDALSITLNGGWFHSLVNADKRDTTSAGVLESTVEKNYKVYGGIASASLNYEFVWLELIWQPYFEFGGGSGKAKFDLDYEREDDSESYNARFRDSFTHVYSGIGLNLINSRGIFSFFKVSNMTFANIKRKFRGIQTGGSVTVTRNEEPDNFSTLVYSFGLGYTY